MANSRVGERDYLSVVVGTERQYARTEASSMERAASPRICHRYQERNPTFQ
jgi:hypothetical protein